jgi:hypothetical protein
MSRAAEKARLFGGPFMEAIRYEIASNQIGLAWRS